jgi:hypothetical protein
VHSGALESTLGTDACGGEMVSKPGGMVGVGEGKVAFWKIWPVVRGHHVGCC